MTWKHFSCNNLGDEFVWSRSSILCDVAQLFLECLPIHTGVKLEQIYVKEMYEMIEKGLRGGLTQCTYKKVNANNKYMEEEYDNAKPSSYKTYLDANNLYELAMCKKLPYKNFKRICTKFDEKKVMRYKDDDDTGYSLEIDLEYPHKIHDLHKDYPMAPEIMTTSEDMLSNVQKDIHRYHYNTETRDEKTKKLVLNVMDHGEEKVCAAHISLTVLPQARLEAQQVHRAISFAQTDVLRPFIEFNTAKRD